MNNILNYELKSLLNYEESHWKYLRMIFEYEIILCFKIISRNNDSMVIQWDSDIF